MATAPHPRDHMSETEILALQEVRRRFRSEHPDEPEAQGLAAAAAADMPRPVMQDWSYEDARRQHAQMQDDGA